MAKKGMKRPSPSENQKQMGKKNKEDNKIHVVETKK